jgi:hypothetical protein
VPGIPGAASVALGSRGGGLEAIMARTWQGNGAQNKGWMAAFWFTGVTLFVMELNAVLNYVEARFADLAPNFLEGLPAWGLAAWKLVESTFWNYGQLEATFRVAPFVTLPFALLGLALAMKVSVGFRRQQERD